MAWEVMGTRRGQRTGGQCYINGVGQVVVPRDVAWHTGFFRGGNATVEIDRDTKRIRLTRTQGEGPRISHHGKSRARCVSIGSALLELCLSWPKKGSVFVPHQVTATGQLILNLENYQWD